MRADGEKGEISPSGLAATSPSVRAFIYLYGRLRLIWRQFLRRSIANRSSVKFDLVGRFGFVLGLVCGGAKPSRSRIKTSPRYGAKIQFYNQKIQQFTIQGE